MAKKNKKLKINHKKTLALSFSIIAICVTMLFVSVTIANKETLKKTKEKDVTKVEKKENIVSSIAEKSLEKTKEVIQPKIQIDLTNQIIDKKNDLEEPKINVVKEEKIIENETPELKTQTTKNIVSESSTVAGGIKEKIEPILPKVKPGSKGIVIFVFDDAGHNLNYLQPYLEIPFPITISVLPKLPFSAEAANRSRLAGKEVMLHQPMQAKNLNINPGPGAILPTDDMDEWAIKNIVLENLKEVGKVSGMNNHEGSLITENAWASGLILDICREKNIYFLDSRTTSESAVPIAAKERGMKIYERDIFIDNTNSHADMLKEIEKGLKICERKGYVIMIGHVRPHGLAKLLTDNYKKWEDAGFAFSTISKAGSKIK